MNQDGTYYRNLFSEASLYPLFKDNILVLSLSGLLLAGGFLACIIINAPVPKLKSIMLQKTVLLKTYVQRSDCLCYLGMMTMIMEKLISYLNAA